MLISLCNRYLICIFVYICVGTLDIFFFFYKMSVLFVVLIFMYIESNFLVISCFF